MGTAPFSGQVDDQLVENLTRALGDLLLAIKALDQVVAAVTALISRLTGA